MHFILCFDYTNHHIWWNYHPWHSFHFSTGRVIFHWHSVSMVQIGSEGKQRSTIHFQWEGWTKRKVGAIPWKCPEYRIRIYRCNTHIVPDRIHHHSQQIGLQLMYKGLFIYFTIDSHILAVKQSKTNIFSTTNKWALHLYNIWLFTAFCCERTLWNAPSVMLSVSATCFTWSDSEPHFSLDLSFVLNSGCEKA